MKTTVQIQKLFTILALSPLMAVSVHAATMTSSNALTSGSLWSVGTNWDTQSAPNSIGDVATFTSKDNVRQDVTGGATLGTLNWTGGYLSLYVDTDLTFNQDGTGPGTATISLNVVGNVYSKINAGSSGSLVINDDLLIQQLNTGNTASANNGAGNYALKITAPLKGSGSITFSNVLNDLDLGMIAIGGNSTNYTGNMTIAKGAVAVAGSNPFGSGIITLGSTGGGSASLILTKNFGFGSNNIVVAANTGGTTVLGSTYTTAASETISGGVTLNQNLTVISRQTTGDANGVYLTGTISGAGGLNINGTVTVGGVATSTAGMVKLTGTNTFTGDTRVVNGSLLLGAAGTGATSLALQNSTLDLATSDSGTVGFGLGSTTKITAVTLGGLSGSRDLALQNTATASAAVALSVGNNNNDTTYTGALTGAGSLTKIGTGKLTLGGVNTYTGATNVTNGTLAVNGSLAAGSAVTVSSGATLAGSGTISGVTTIQGTLAAGNSIGTLHTGNLTLASTSVLNVELGRNGSAATSDLTSVTGSVNIVSGADLKLTLYTGLSDLLGGDIIFLIDNNDTDAVQGAFTSLNGVTTTLSEGSQFAWNSQTWEITYGADYGTSSFSGGNDVALMVVVPEPSTWAMIVGGMGILAFGQHLRRRSN